MHMPLEAPIQPLLVVDGESWLRHARMVWSAWYGKIWNENYVYVSFWIEPSDGGPAVYIGGWELDPERLMPAKQLRAELFQGRADGMDDGAHALVRLGLLKGPVADHGATPQYFESFWDAFFRLTARLTRYPAQRAGEALAARLGRA
jgi:hypothetical protein